MNEIQQPLRIAITGPESSGKSTLALELAAHYGAPYAVEFAREYLSPKSGKYTFADLDAICRGQLNLEAVAVQQATGTGMVIFDTDMLVLKVWSTFRFGKLSGVLNQAIKAAQYDFYLLCYPDLPWSPDPLRESPDVEERQLLCEIFKKELDAMAATYSIIKGAGAVRTSLAVEAIEKFRFGRNL